MSDKRSILQEISREFVEVLARHKVPQTEIARLTDKNKGTVSRIFNGTYAFSLDDIKLIASELKIPTIGIITRHLCGELSPDMHNMLQTLEAAETTLCNNLNELQAIKKARGKKAAS
ncbi:MAG: helix-turn-helix transcriptional regulator [Sedimentisphaerales bacterium]|nr:helix-turn-helix transcriptional regulator [Sedimentisphaerales bacterium]